MTPDGDRTGKEAGHESCWLGFRSFGSHSLFFSLLFVSLLGGTNLGFAAESQAPSLSANEESSQPTKAGEFQGQGVHKVPQGKNPREIFAPRQPQQPGGGLPPHLCQQITHMVTQCRCTTTTDCQILTGLSPGGCQAGSRTANAHHYFEARLPHLPSSLCGFQVATVVTQCTCTNQTDCQVLSTICPNACSAGSQSGTCRPLRRGN